MCWAAAAQTLRPVGLDFQQTDGFRSSHSAGKARLLRTNGVEVPGDLPAAASIFAESGASERPSGDAFEVEGKGPGRTPDQSLRRSVPRVLLPVAEDVGVDEEARPAALGHG